MAGESSWIDKHGDVWTLETDGLLHTPETAPFPREHVEKKWGPLRAILAEHPATPAEPDAGGEGLTEAERLHAYEHFDVDEIHMGRCYLEPDVARIVADRERRAEARGGERALREAAEEIDRDPSIRLRHNVAVVCSCVRCETAMGAARLLRDRADRIAGEGQ